MQCETKQQQLEPAATDKRQKIMIKYGIKHINKGYLVRTQDDRVEYKERNYKHIIWLGTHDEAASKLDELGRRFHDMVSVVM